MRLLDFLDNACIFLSAGFVDDVVKVLSNAGPVCGNDDDGEPVDVVEFGSFSLRGTGHAG